MSAGGLDLAGNTRPQRLSGARKVSAYCNTIVLKRNLSDLSYHAKLKQLSKPTSRSKINEQAFVYVSTAHDVLLLFYIFHCSPESEKGAVVSSPQNHCSSSACRLAPKAPFSASRADQYYSKSDRDNIGRAHSKRSLLPPCDTSPPQS
jgi:hypothetical protein